MEGTQLKRASVSMHITQTLLSGLLPTQTELHLSDGDNSVSCYQVVPNAILPFRLGYTNWGPWMSRSAISASKDIW